MAKGSKKMKELIDSFSDQIKVGYELGAGIKMLKPSKIVFSGMGGSAIAASLIKPYLTDKLQVIVNRYYDLPKQIDQKTWIVPISYSGNTEETIAVFKEALRNNSPMFAISSGGELEKLAVQNNVKLIKLPADLPPRASLGYQFFALLRVMVENGLLPPPNIDAISKAADEKDIDKLAKSIAAKLVKKVPLIYASEPNSAIAYRMKTQFNENAKVHAFFHVLPEMNHNEILGYTKLNAKYVPIFLNFPDDHERVRKRIFVTQKLIKPTRCITVKPKGSSSLERFAYTIHLGDLISYYLAEKLRIDPYPVPVIERLKKELKR